jgi:CDP-glucose 4,6-dehydratase
MVAASAAAGVSAQVTPEFWRGRRVFVTGHTGFKGSWLSLWLEQMGAVVLGYSLDPPSTPSLFETARVADGLESVHADICNLDHLQRTMASFAPEFVLHMAAQSLVRRSYADPIGTYQTNVMGTANVLEAVRWCPSVHVVLVITTDKCYENREWVWPYREIDALGGYDPYSNSKACAELVVSAYRNSFFHPARRQEHGVSVATARAGNVIGGGDWAADRLIPDLMRSFSKAETVAIRNPHATRPWQHVLEPVRGYLSLAQALAADGERYSGAWNFGPHATDARPVAWIVERLAKAWGPSARWEVLGGDHPHEAQMLKLDWSKASAELGWEPALRLPDALAMTLDWYREVFHGADARAKTMEQIRDYAARQQAEAAPQ